MKKLCALLLLITQSSLADDSHFGKFLENSLQSSEQHLNNLGKTLNDTLNNPQLQSTLKEASEPLQAIAGMALSSKEQEIEQATQVLNTLVDTKLIDENALSQIGQAGEYLNQFVPQSTQKSENNFHQVSSSLFRSEQLDAQDLPLLRQHNIRTLVNLRFFNRGEDEAQFSNTELNLVNIPMVAWSISPEQIAQALYAIEQGEKQGAVLVHCYHGSDRTGLVVGMYRIIMQNWSIADAERELREGGYGYHAIWQNIRHYFDDQGVNSVRQALNTLRQSAQHNNLTQNPSKDALITH